MTPRLIVSCDDLGLHPAVNRGIADVLAAGVVRSASLMAPGAAFDDAVGRLRVLGVRRVGVHLTLSAEYAKLPMRPLSGGSSLTGADGRFRSEPPAAPDLDVAEVERELRAQVERVRDAGLGISHLDGHMFCYEPSVAGTQDLLRVVLRVAAELRVPVRCRVPYPGRPVGRTRMIWRDHPTRDSRLAYYRALLDGYTDSLSELIVHPAAEAGDFAGLVRGPERRFADREFFADPELITRARAGDFEVVGWADL